MKKLREGNEEKPRTVDSQLVKKKNSKKHIKNPFIICNHERDLLVYKSCICHCVS